ncbi:MAG: TonB-dependent receptor [Rubrivivax sp.]|nr:TonB-dependent receptor [Rubrivivax sp.]
MTVGSRWRGVLLGAVAWGCAAPLQAQETPATRQVEVRGSAAGERRESVAGRQVIDAAELTRHGDTRLADALRRVSGLVVSGSGAELSIRLDGMAAEQTLVLVNGEPVPRQQMLDALALGDVERIEIARGANVQWSGRGLAGTINIVTRRQARRAQRDLSLTLGAHFGRPIGQAELTLGDRDGRTSWRLGLTARGERERYPVEQRLRFADAQGNVRSAYRVHVEEAAHDDALTLTPLWQWSAADGRRLLAEAVLTVSRFQGAGEDERSEVQGERPRMQHDRLAYRHDRTFARMRVDGAWPLAGGARVAGALTASHGRRVQDSLLTGEDFDGIAVRDSTVDSTRQDDFLSGRASIEQRLGTAHTLVAGMQLESNRGREVRVQRERIPSWEPDLTDERYDATARSVAAYVQDDWLPDRQTTLSLGVRLERLTTRSEGNVFDGVSQQHRLSSPMLNAMWRPDALTQWQLGLSRAYRLPEPRDIMPRRWTRPENSSLVPDFFGNPDLRPESAWTLQAGWERRLADDARLTLGGVLRRIDDVVLRDLLLLNDRYLLRPVNQGRAWVISLQAGAQAAVAVPWVGDLSLKGGVTARASRVEALPGPDNRVPDQSPWELQLDAEHRPLAANAWSLNAAWRWRAATRAQVPGDRLLTRNATRSLDVSALWQATAVDRLRFSVSGISAADEVETTRRRVADGQDDLLSRTRREPRWRVQWMRPL